MISVPRHLELPSNEPTLMYAPGSEERPKIKKALKQTMSECPEIPCIIGGQRVNTGNLESIPVPHNHGHTLAKYHAAGEAEIKQAINAAQEAKKEWGSLPWDVRASVLMKAAELLSDKHRMTLNAATMAGQSKTPHQAEIDSACELIDFWRFNSYFAQELLTQQPHSPKGQWNVTEMRPLDGFVLAITPFNFTAIGGNLPTAPALMGNTVLWKPSESQTLAAYRTYLILEEAGLPPGVINFLPGSGADISQQAMASRDFAGLHFTGSTAVFKSLWKRVAENLDNYLAYPRIVGETGGKDFIFAHPDCNEDALVTALVRGAFEYQGQKCSAASRAYIPKSVWERIKAPLCDTTSSLKMGDIADFENFLGAVIKQDAFDRLTGELGAAKTDSSVEILVGGGASGGTGWFIEPTIVQCQDPSHKLMKQELFGPVLSIHVYPDKQYGEMLRTAATSADYALTGAIFAHDRSVIEQASEVLRFAAGNFYINDKPTGSVVNQQPFGGSRASGTNDKAGSPANLMRWASPRAIKETFVAPTDHTYPYMDKE